MSDPSVLGSLFSPDFVTARHRFREAATALGCQLHSYSIGANGPLGEELTMDVAITSSLDSGRTLVISSGMHGVEGFMGSAVQLSALRALPRVRCVLVHGLNPYGFAWRRRWNEGNVDLNRNLLLDGELFSGSPAGYAPLDGLLNPKRPPSAFEPVLPKFLLAIAKHGMPALKEAIASGQYDYPQGLFFGGHGPSATSEILKTHFAEWIGESAQVVHLDLHSGLGRSGSCKLLVDYSLSEAQRKRLSDWFGPEAFESSSAQGVAYSTRGSFGRWCISHFPAVDYTYVAAEFGTYPATKVLAGLRAENQAYHWGKASDPSTERAKRRLMELFCPASETWRAKVLAHSRLLVKQAVGALTLDSD